MALHLDRVDARAKLAPRRDPYWQRLTQGRFIGFRRMAAGSPGTWLARCYVGDGYEFHSLGDFATLTERERFDAAKGAADEWFRHLDTGGAVNPGTVKAACESYADMLERERGKQPADDARGRFVRLVYSDPIARIDLAKLTRLHVNAWRERVLAAGSSPSSFNRNATALRAALNMAKEAGAVASDHAWSAALKPFKSADGRRELYLDGAQRADLIEHAAVEARGLFNALRLLPMRPGEVASLKVEHFDSRRKILNVPKGKTDSRTVPLSADAIAFFKGCAKDKLPGAWLISRADGSQWKKEQWRDEIKAAARKAKLPRATVAYTLRHSVITDLVTGGLDLFTVAQISGTSVAMIEKHYGKLRHERARAALDALAKL